MPNRCSYQRNLMGNNKISIDGARLILLFGNEDATPLSSSVFGTRKPHPFIKLRQSFLIIRRAFNSNFKGCLFFQGPFYFLFRKNHIIADIGIA